MSDFNKKVSQGFDQLVGLTIVGLSGLEMAAAETKGGCIFGVEPFEFVQLATLVLETKDTFYEVGTYSSDDLQALYGLLVKPIDPEKWITSRTTHTNDIFRPYRMADFQFGTIESMVKLFDPSSI